MEWRLDIGLGSHPFLGLGSEAMEARALGRGLWSCGKPPRQQLSLRKLGEGRPVSRVQGRPW